MLEAERRQVQDGGMKGEMMRKKGIKKGEIVTMEAGGLKGNANIYLQHSIYSSYHAVVCLTLIINQTICRI